MKNPLSFGLAIFFNVVAWNVTAQAQISLTGASYTQDFDSMGSTGTTTPSGWFVGSFANAANLPPVNGAVSSTGVTAGTGSSTTGTNYNFGVAGINAVGERALGSLASAGIQRNTEVRFVNNTGGFITSFNASYTGEQWRNGGNASLAAHTNFMQYSTDGINFVNMGSTFDFVSPNQVSATAATLDGNAPTNRVTGRGGVYTPALAIPMGATFYLRWADIDNTGNDHALAVDDFSITTTTSTTAQYWDTNADTAGTGGAGTWDVTSLNWNPLSDGTGTTVAYDSAKTAIFGGTPATVAIDGGGVTANGGLQFDANYVIQAGALTLGSLNGIGVAAGQTATINSVISGSVGLGKGGSGTLMLGGANDFTGTTTVSAGTLAAGGNSIPDSGSVAVAGGAFRLDANETIGGLTGSGTVLLNGNILTISNATDFVFSGTATNAGGITKKGSGVWTNNSATHNYTGNTRVEEGRIVIPINTATLGASNGTIVFAGGEMEWKTSRTFENPILFESNVTLYGNFPSGATAVFGVLGGLNGTAPVSALTGTEVITLRNLNLTNFSLRLRPANLNLTNPIVIGVSGDAGRSYLRCDSHVGVGDQFLRGDISGTGVFERNNNAAVYGYRTILTGNNTYQGGTDLKGGFIGIGSDSALSTGDINIGFDTQHLGLCAHGTSRVVTNTIVFRSDYSASATNLHIGGSEALTLSNITLNPLNTQRLTVSNTAITTVAGVINGATGIEKTGTGTLVFSGANLYTGATVINAGKLRVNNSTGSGTGSGNVTVASGATFGGTGIASGTVAVNSGATIAAGTSVESLDTGSQTWAGGATNIVEINDATGTEGSGWDLINITGGLTINATSGNKFTINVQSLTGSSSGPAANFSSASPYSWTILKTTTGITGFDPNSFTIDASGFQNSLNGGLFSLSTNNGGNDLVLTFSVAAAAPVILVDPVGVTVSAGGNAQFSVTATGDEPLTYRWKRNGVNLSDGGVISGATTATLTLTGVSQSDAGNYTVGITNNAGSTNSPIAILTVIDPPVITTALTNQNVNEGANVTFFVATSGTQPVTYVWKKNGVTIDGATTDTLNFPSVVSTNSGTYEVFVSNSAGTNSSTSILTVNAPPVITVQPQSVATSAGANANFSVTATGSSLEYQWSRNGVAIGGATDSSYTVVASSASIGSYSVVVSNELGTATSSSASLTINSQSLLFDNFDGYADQAAFEAAWPKVTANSGALTTSTSSSAPNSISIDITGTQRNGRTFTESGIPSPTNTITFSFDFYDSNAAASPYRQYGSIQDGTPTATSQLVSLGMNNNQTLTGSGGNYYMARILGYTVPTTADPDGGSAESVGGAGAFFKLNDFGVGLRTNGWHNLKVVISSDDGLSTDYAFYVDGVLAELVSNVGTAATLRSYDNVRLGSGVSSTTVAHYDNYSVSRTAPPLNITAQPQNVSTNAGSTVVFSVTAPGATVYQWKKDGSNISGATTSSLTLTNVLDANEGSYSVYLENGFSTTNSASATLTVSDPAINTQPQSVTTNTLQSVTFTVGAAGTGTLLYQWNKDGNILSGATDSSYNIASTATNDSGAGYQVVVTGANGSVTSSVAVLTVNLSTQAITFAALSDKNVGDPDFGVSATASSGLPVTFTSLTPSVVTVSGTNVTIVGAGTATIRASQAGDANYSAALDVDRSFTVTSAAAQPTGFTSTAAGSGTFVGTPGATYTVQYTDSFTPINWLTLTNVVTDSGTGVGSFTDPTDPATRDQRYYRITAP